MVRTAYLLNTWHTRVNALEKALSSCSTVSRHTYTHSSYGVTTKVEVQPFPAQVVILGTTMSLAVSSRPLTTVAQLRPQVGAYEIYGG